jgi:hypothetical protein
MPSESGARRPSAPPGFRTNIMAVRIENRESPESALNVLSVSANSAMINRHRPVFEDHRSEEGQKCP